MDYRPLPIGYENFNKLITEGYYYVDKTLFIKELLDKKSSVNLFTRPRRFGKTLTLSMLRYYFEDACDWRGNKEDYRHLFDGLRIMEQGERYTKHMAQYPVISLTLKSGKQSTFSDCMGELCYAIANEFSRHEYLLKCGQLSEHERETFIRFMNQKGESGEYKHSLKFLCDIMKKVTGKDTIVLLDEYDVPLEGAYHYGYYDEMVDFIRGLFESTLKTNDSLYFAVITGCLRISKESIFTGLNNLEINSVLGTRYGEYFGFTEQEMKQLCKDYQLSDKCEEIREWYNGYLFGNVNVYNPWSTIRYIKDHADNPDAFPQPYWSNTSSNTIVRTLIDRADRSVKDEIESLIAGGTIEKPVQEDGTYEEVNQSMDNLWSFMFFTGYFKKISERFDNHVCYITMKIPNQEVLYIFENKVRGWFDEQMKKQDLQPFYQAIADKDTDTMSDEIADILYSTISFYDYYENFYHGFLAGILYGMERYVVKSNRESGRGRTDLFLRPVSRRKTAYIFEFKCSRRIQDMEKDAGEALRQIYDKRYDMELRNDGYMDIVGYGISFFEKDCFVVEG